MRRRLDGEMMDMTTSRYSRAKPRIAFLRIAGVSTAFQQACWFRGHSIHSSSSDIGIDIGVSIGADRTIGTDIAIAVVAAAAAMAVAIDSST